MKMHLRCVHPHHGYERGQTVTDESQVAAILASDKEHHFVRVAAPEEPAAEPPPIPSED